MIIDKSTIEDLLGPDGVVKKVFGEIYDELPCVVNVRFDCNGFVSVSVNTLDCESSITQPISKIVLYKEVQQRAVQLRDKLIIDRFNDVYYLNQERIPHSDFVMIKELLEQDISKTQL